MKQISSLRTTNTAARCAAAAAGRSGPAGWRPALLLGLLALGLGGCATHGDKPPLQHGWIGGHYLLAAKPTVPRAIFFSRSTYDPADYPDSLRRTQKTAIRVKHLGTNAPAYRAGLREGDLIVELNHQPATSRRAFLRAVAGAQPGTLLPVKVLRAGQTADYNVTVGRETYRKGGNFSIIVPSVVHGWDLWPNPGFSLVVVGFEPNGQPRPELPPQPAAQPPYAENWQAFLVVLDLSLGERILSQETLPP